MRADAYLWTHFTQPRSCHRPAKPLSLPLTEARRMIGLCRQRISQPQGDSMKLVRFGPRGREKPGIIDSKGAIRDLSKVVPDIAGETLSPKGLAKIRKASIDKLPLVRGNASLGPCVGGIGNLLDIGLKHSD